MNLAFVLADRMLAASAMLPLEMWQAAASTAQGRHRVRPPLHIETIAAHAGATVATQAGIALTPNATLSSTTNFDVIYLPALWRNPRPVLTRSAALHSWLRAQLAAGALVSAVGTGCCFLAEAGLLDGKAATTHWHYFDRFARDYPAVQLKRQYFITQANAIFCAASVNAMADVTVHLIERFYGRAIAHHVERNFSHEIRRPFDNYRFLDGEDLQHADELIVEIQLAMQRRLQEQLRISELAREFGVSPRSLDRRFRAAIGVSPLTYLQQQRIKMAKELLESTNLSVGEIAYRVGYFDHGHFTRLFERALTVGPRAYRQTVRAKLFALQPR
ncbi:MAG: helix-turn-helix domain-containing protein [Gammaproteobacteria bacterium]|nr:helix-turn-helix domain-containing protein [Gammaproteobacteria bacterium]